MEQIWVTLQSDSLKEPHLNLSSNVSQHSWPKFHLPLSGVFTFVARYLNIYRCMLTYFEEAVNLVKLYTNYFTLNPRSWNVRWNVRTVLTFVR